MSFALMPSLTEIRNLVVDSTPDHWSVIEPGPYYLDRVVPIGSGAEVELQEHTVLAVYRPDVDLAIAWGMHIDADDSGDRLRYTWRFPDPAMFQIYVDIFWRGALVDRRVVIAVDGFRAYLPATRAVVVDSGTSQIEVVAETARAYDVAVARLVNAIPGGGEFDRYFAESEIVEVPDKPDEAIT